MCKQYCLGRQAIAKTGTRYNNHTEYTNSSDLCAHLVLPWLLLSPLWLLGYREGRYLAESQKCRVSLARQGPHPTPLQPHQPTTPPQRGPRAQAQAPGVHGGGATAPAKTEGYLRAYIGNLSYEISEEQVEGFFSGCRVSSVRLARDGVSGKCRGFGHVDFEDDASLEAAVAEGPGEGPGAAHESCLCCHCPERGGHWHWHRLRGRGWYRH